MNRVGVASLCLLCAIAFVNAGCTGKVAATNNPPPVMPSIATQPTNQTVTIGQTATFMVVAAGTAPLSYQWQENGTAISGATSASYTTAATSSSDNGAKFQVVVSNSAGSVTSNAVTLMVNAAAAAPSITTQRATHPVTVGQTATFMVVATGTAPLSYQWQKNGTAISGATSASYTTAATTSSDNGAQFVVVVSNTAGSVTSNAATLTVNAGAVAPLITTQPANQTVTVGQMATFTVVATGTAPLSYAWRKNGTAISGATAASYTTPATTSSDNSAQFTVTVSNVAGNVTSNPATLTVTTGTGGGTMPQFGHVFIVEGENTSFSSTYSSSNMPYLTSLANQYGVSLHYWADTHPSIGNDLNLASGVISTNNDSATPSSLPLAIDNIAHEVEQAGKTWKDYAESDPNISGCGGLKSGAYFVRHDPLKYFTNINTANFVCFSQFATDLANNTLPNFSWLAPNGCDDAHDCSIGTFDTWLKTEIGPLLASSYFQPGGDGLLIITFDEDDKGGTPSCTTTTVGQGCGGQVETVVVSARSKLAYQSTAGDPANFNSTYDEASILRTIADALGLKTSGLGAAAARVPMADFFQ